MQPESMPCARQRLLDAPGYLDAARIDIAPVEDRAIRGARERKDGIERRVALLALNLQIPLGDAGVRMCNLHSQRYSLSTMMPGGVAVQNKRRVGAERRRETAEAVLIRGVLARGGLSAVFFVSLRAIGCDPSV